MLLTLFLFAPGNPLDHLDRHRRIKRYSVNASERSHIAWTALSGPMVQELFEEPLLEGLLRTRRC
jgi:hypothetical protein